MGCALCAGPVSTIVSANPNSNPRTKLRGRITETDRCGASAHHDLHHSRLCSNPLSSEKVSARWRISGNKAAGFRAPRAGIPPREPPGGLSVRDGSWEPKGAAGQRERTAPKRKTPDGRGGPSGVPIAAAIECVYAVAVSAPAGGDPLRGAWHPRAASTRSAAPE